MPTRVKNRRIKGEEGKAKQAEVSDLQAFKVHHVADTIPFRGWSACQPYI
jgi:hypothetical protein